MRGWEWGNDAPSWCKQIFLLDYAPRLFPVGFFRKGLAEERVKEDQKGRGKRTSGCGGCKRAWGLYGCPLCIVAYLIEGRGKLNKTGVGVNTTNQNSCAIPPSLFLYFCLFCLLPILVLKYFTVFIQTLFLRFDCNEICIHRGKQE